MQVMRKLLKIPSMDDTDGQNWYPQSGTGDVGQQVVCSSCSWVLDVMDNGLVAQTSLEMISADHDGDSLRRCRQPNKATIWGWFVSLGDYLFLGYHHA